MKQTKGVRHIDRQTTQTLGNFGAQVGRQCRAFPKTLQPSAQLAVQRCLQEAGHHHRKHRARTEELQGLTDRRQGRHPGKCRRIGHLHDVPGQGHIARDQAHQLVRAGAILAQLFFQLDQNRRARWNIHPLEQGSNLLFVYGGIHFQ